MDTPRPGVSKRKKDTEAAQAVLTMTVKGDVFKLAPNNIATMEKTQVLLQVGAPLETFVGNGNKIGDVSLVVLYWLARRASGEPDLKWEVAAAEWDALELTEADVALDVSAPKGDDPEA